MSKKIYSKIIGTGSYIPPRIIANSSFLDNEFYDPDGKKIDLPASEIISKFESDYRIQKELRFVDDKLVAQR